MQHPLPMQILHPLRNLMHTPQQIKLFPILQALQISDQTAILAIRTNEEPRPHLHYLRQKVQERSHERLFQISISRVNNLRGVVVARTLIATVRLRQVPLYTVEK